MLRRRAIRITDIRRHPRITITGIHIIRIIIVTDIPTISGLRSILRSFSTNISSFITTDLNQSDTLDMVIISLHHMARQGSTAVLIISLHKTELSDQQQEPGHL
jgi:hypothetical protein